MNYNVYGVRKHAWDGVELLNYFFNYLTIYSPIFIADHYVGSWLHSILAGSRLVCNHLIPSL